jgi:MSHA biogenesis protein MshQ
VGVDLTSMSWLRFDWNQEGDYADVLLPNANFEFGTYRGNDRIIYWRERLQ